MIFKTCKLVRTFLITFFIEYIKIGVIRSSVKSFSEELMKIKYVYFTDGKSVMKNTFDFVWFNIKKRYIRLKIILFRDQTTSVRFFFGLMCIGLASFFLFSSTLSLTEDSSEYRKMLEIFPRWVWASAYFVIGISFLYGVIEEKFNFFLLITEGLLSVLTWCLSCYYIYLSQNVLGAHFIGSIMSIWLYVRYPTHKMKSDSYYKRKVVGYVSSFDKEKKGGQ